MRKRDAVLLLALMSAGSAASSCSSRIKIGQELPLAAAGATANAGGGQGGASAGGAGLALAGDAGASPGAPCQMAACQGKVYRCGDCIDNDGDGLIDAADPECTGPCDDTEDSFFIGIPGANNAACRQDCYFDQDTGTGNDQCYWSQDCDPLSVAPDYPPSGDSRCAYDPATHIPGTNATCAELAAAQDPACISYCGPLTPNGCDGFGCCELPAGSGKFVWLGSNTRGVGSCDEATLGDATACRPCTPVQPTLNPCDPCEVCVGRPSPAPSCAGSPSFRCPSGLAACGQAGEAPCQDGAYCITGCCQASPK